MTDARSPYLDAKDDGTPVVVVHPGRVGGCATVGSSRLPCEILAGMIAAGDDVDSIANAYGIRPEFVILACWYMARYGGRRWKREWKGWLGQVDGKLWHSDYYDVPAPPAFSARG
jgi:uncharacterized protein (DUF433 family)